MHIVIVISREAFIVCLNCLVVLGRNYEEPISMIKHHFYKNSQIVAEFHQSPYKRRSLILVISNNAAIILSITKKYKVILRKKVGGINLNVRAKRDKSQWLEQIGQINLTIRILFTQRHSIEVRVFITRYLGLILRDGLCYSMNLWQMGIGEIKKVSLRRNGNFVCSEQQFLRSFCFFNHFQLVTFYCSFLSQLSLMKLIVLKHRPQLRTIMKILSVKYISYLCTMQTLIQKYMPGITAYKGAKGIFGNLRDISDKNKDNAKKNVTLTESQMMLV